MTSISSSNSLVAELKLSSRSTTMWFLSVTNPEETKEVSEIIDRTVTEPISTDTALEKFYETYDSVYYYGSIKSEYVIVKYTDGTSETVKDALANGRIKIDDLDKFGIHYIKEPKPV